MGLAGTWDLPGSGIELVSFLWRVDSLTLSHQGGPSHFFFFFFECAKSKHKDMRYPKLETCDMIEMRLQQGSLQKHHLDYLLNTISLIRDSLLWSASRVMLKILQARLQQYVNRELPDVQAGFRKGRGTRDQIANICWILEKAREFQKNIYFCFIDYAKAFDCVDHNKLWKILKEMRIPDHLAFLLRNLNAGQEATVRTGHGTTDWFQIGKGVHQGCILSPCLFNLYA